MMKQYKDLTLKQQNLFNIIRTGWLASTCDRYELVEVLGVMINQYKNKTFK